MALKDKNILHEADRTELLRRLNNISAEDRPRWGTMNAAQLFDHLVKYQQMVLGTRPVKKIGNALTAALLRWWFLGNRRFPKSLRTAKQLLPTDPGTVEQAKSEHQTLFNEVLQKLQAGQEMPPSPIFGKLTNRQLGHIIYKHLDHHARQFGQ